MAKKKEDPEKGKNTEGDGSSDGGDDGDGGDGGSDEKKVTMTQKALNKQFADRADRASQSAVNKLLKGVGFEDTDGLKEALKTLKDIQDGEKTDQEKLQGDLDASSTEVDTLKGQVAIANARVETMVTKGAIMVAARKLNFIPESEQDIWLLIKSDSELGELLTYDSETLKVTGSDDVVKKVAKMRPHWVESSNSRHTPGGRRAGKGKSQSNNSRENENERDVPMVHF
jgi:hypothetical protein